MTSGFEVLRVAGSDYDCGVIVGAAQNGLLAQLLDKVQRSTAGSWDDEIQRTSRYLPAAEQYFPYLVAQLRGIADGSHLSFANVFTLSIDEDTNRMRDHNRCFDVVINSSQPTIGHNNDNDNEFEKMVRAVEWTTERGIVLSVGLGPFTCTCIGVSRKQNGRVLCLSGDDLTSKDEKSDGIPRALIARATLDADDLTEAIAIANHPERASSYYNVLADERTVFCAEGTATKLCFLEPIINDIILHANAYIHPEMVEFEGQPDTSSSKARMSRGMRLAKTSGDSMSTVFRVQDILKDHGKSAKPSNNTICRHGIVGTVLSSIIDMGARNVSVALGPPCENDYQVIWRF